MTVVIDNDVTHCFTFDMIGGQFLNVFVFVWLGSDACVGRNGAPLFERTGNVMYLRGMASFGPLPCHDVSTKGIPGVYASIDFYVPWIKSQLKPWKNQKKTKLY